MHALPSCRSRVVKAMAADPTGLGSLLTRYLSSTQLPPGFEGPGPGGAQVRLVCLQLVALQLDKNPVAEQLVHEDPFPGNPGSACM